MKEERECSERRNEYLACEREEDYRMDNHPTEVWCSGTGMGDGMMEILHQFSLTGLFIAIWEGKRIR